MRGTFHHNPSSLRLSMADPNLQQVPRDGRCGKCKGCLYLDCCDTVPSSWVKDCFVAPEGSTFWERDFSGIEAVLVGYFAGAPGYIRLAKRDVHSFYTAYALNAIDGRIAANDLPDLSWPDDKLFRRLEEIKQEFKYERNSLYKHLVHGANYLQSPGGAAEHIFKNTGKAFDKKLITEVMGVYFELFPEIRKWHQDICRRVDGTKRHEQDPSQRVDPWSLGVAYAQNPFGYIHRFYNVLDWEKVNGEWISTLGEDAKRLVSFLPQSTAAAIIKQAAKRLYYEFPWVGETLRLLIHDSILGECAERNLQECLETSDLIMSAPVMELPLDPSWNMGEFLSIGTEAKVGRSWGTMQ